MKSSTYKFVKTTDGITLYAEVAVSIANTSQAQRVVISEHVFDWLKEAHGPNATIWPVKEDDEFVRGARRGIEYALKHLPNGFLKQDVTVTVEKIHVLLVDSTSDTVAYAACFATWQALGANPSSTPQIRGRQIIFE